MYQLGEKVITLNERGWPVSSDGSPWLWQKKPLPNGPWIVRT
jgi:hypothetical protein